VKARLDVPLVQRVRRQRRHPAADPDRPLQKPHPAPSPNAAPPCAPRYGPRGSRTSRLLLRSRRRSRAAEAPCVVARLQLPHGRTLLRRRCPSGGGPQADGGAGCCCALASSDEPSLCDREHERPGSHARATLQPLRRLPLRVLVVLSTGIRYSSFSHFPSSTCLQARRAERERGVLRARLHRLLANGTAGRRRTILSSSPRFRLAIHRNFPCDLRLRERRRRE